MEYTSKVSDGSFIVGLSGKWTLQEHATARAMLTDALGCHQEQVVIDVSRLSFIDSASIGMLLIMGEELARAHKSVSLTGAQGAVNRVFRAIRLDQVLGRSHERNTVQA